MPCGFLYILLLLRTTHVLRSTLLQTLQICTAAVPAERPSPIATRSRFELWAVPRYTPGSRAGGLVHDGRDGQRGPAAVAGHAPSPRGPLAARKAPEEVRPPWRRFVLPAVYTLYDARTPGAVPPANAPKAGGGGDAAGERRTQVERRGRSLRAAVGARPKRGDAAGDTEKPAGAVGAKSGVQRDRRVARVAGDGGVGQWRHEGVSRAPQPQERRGAVRRWRVEAGVGQACNDV